MNEEVKLMTNRQLSQLCAKGLCEWSSKVCDKVYSYWSYSCKESDEQVPDWILIRPFEKIIFTDADENTWYTPTEEAFTALIGGDRTRRVFGF